MEESSRPPLGEIRVIIGGSSTGQSSKSKKAYLKVVQSVQLSGRSPRARTTDEAAITFTDEDAERIHHPHDDALVITLMIADYTTRRVLVDNGSLADILYYPAFQQMRLGRDWFRPVNSPLVGFGGMKVQPVGTISLSVVVGAYPRQVTKDVNFLVVDCPSSYNVIIGRPTLNSWKAVTSTYHLSVKFATEHGVGQVQGDQLAARECYLAMLAMDEQIQAMNIEERRMVAEPTEALEDISLDEENPEKYPSVIIHRLNVCPSSKPVRQKKRVFAPERNDAIKDEVQKLMGARFIREVYYPDWLANVVMVKKANGKWRMCMDFTDLNKACPKDSYPLPRIDQLVDSTAGHKLLSFMDAFSGYNQIRMDEANQEKTSFVTSQGLFCYKVMSFGLKNTGATYQRLVNHMFRQQIGRNVEVYIDDMLVKSQDEGRHLDDLQETFDTLRQYHMKLNPSKCAFGVSSGKFLGFMVSYRGIEANPDKIQAILDMKPPQNTKEIQSLTGRVAALNRKLRHYFQAHVINVMMDHPLKKAMNRLEAVGRLIQWAVELSEFDIRYQPRHAKKAQVLADFIAEFTPSHDETEGNDKWVVHVDGSSTKYAGGIGVVLQSPEGDKLRHKVRLQYQATNNEVEYEALLKGLELAKSVEAKSILVLGDSQLVMGQVNEMYEAKEERMRKYLSRVMRLMKRFEKAEFVQIPREENVEADTIAKEASANEFMDESDEIQYMPSIDIPEVQQVENRGNWMTPIISYLKDG
ncbi:uncharacterized protein LOC126722250 [Quercus robur]|uniref:uncharacterized protein LOC126722250 n=1 Tax=Quercus robur TaxID=38942 RepID=UPI002163F6B4|nr:uncharacterized protein LOC126722250 [Quercus robur]